MNDKAFLLGSLHLTLTGAGEHPAFTPGGFCGGLWCPHNRTSAFKAANPPPGIGCNQAQLFAKTLPILSLWRALLPWLTGSHSRYLSRSIVYTPGSPLRTSAYVPRGLCVGRFCAPSCLDHISPSQKQPAQARVRRGQLETTHRESSLWEQSQAGLCELSALPGSCSFLHRLPLEKMQTL